MYRIANRKTNRARRILKIRQTIMGTKETPRLTVFRSNKYIYGALIDDTANKVLVDVSDQVKKLHAKVTKILGAKEVGKALAQKATEAGIKKVVFDRRGYRYHGRVQNLADGAREGGLKF